MTEHLLRREPAVWGGAAWLATAATSTTGVGQLTLVEAVLLFAILVVVPLALPLLPATSRANPALALIAGAPTAPALLLEQGVPAGLLALPWLAFSATVALVAVKSLASKRGIVELVWVAAAAYLTVGAGWLVADRLDLEPAGFAAPFVLLTAIHFHYAGFASSLLAGCAARWRMTRLTALAITLIVAAPPIVALGFTFYGPLQVAGASLLTAGLWSLAWQLGRRVGPSIGGVAGTLLIVSALATLAPMLLAVQWAIGANYATPALSIPEMAQWHGVTNAVGFAFLGTLGWRMATSERSVTDLPR